MVSLIENPTVIGLDSVFTPDDPQYNPNHPECLSCQFSGKGSF